jgi:hypothetical protein
MLINNPKFNKDGSIDCEIEHPELGWVPFTARSNDPEKHGKFIFEQALAKDPTPYKEVELIYTDTEKKTSMLKKLTVLFSQLLNVLFFNGQPDETVSGRAWREGELLGDPVWSKRRKKIDALFFWAPDHCLASHLKDVEFAKLILK